MANLFKFFIITILLITFIFPCLANTKRLYCSTCNKSIRRNRTYVVDSEKNPYCNQRCFRKTLPACSLCQRQAPKMLKAHDGQIFCIPCSKLARCSSCQKPGAKIQLPDDRKLCTSCYTNGINDINTIRKYFNHVREELKVKLGLFTPNLIHLKVVDKRELDQKSGQPGQPVSGCYHYEYKTQTTIKKNRLGKVVDKKTKIVNKKHTIYVLSHLPVDKLKTVLAHELTHDWHHYYYPKLKDLTDSEGAAQYITWIYCKLNNLPNLAKEIELNKHPVYATGFKRVKSHAQNSKLTGLRSYLDQKYR